MSTKSLKGQSDDEPFKEGLHILAKLIARRIMKDLQKAKSEDTLDIPIVTGEKIERINTNE